MVIFRPQDPQKCKHTDLPPWDEPYPGDDDIGKYDSYEIRKKWPRRQCPECSCICYESFTHYIAGDW